MEVSNHHPRLTVDSNSHHNNINNNNISQQQLIDRTSRLKLGNSEKMENGNGGVYQLPVVHPIVSAPRCEACTTKSTTSFFDFECPQCEALVTDVHQQQQPTSIAQLMAIARQWTPAVQGRMNLLIMEMLRRGAHADDRDGLTDMTLLHFAVKSGAAGLGNAEAAMALAEYLVETAHADATLRCRWNDTTALHIATFYDVAPVVGYLVSVLASSSVPGTLDAPSSVLEGRTALHIAAANLCLRSAKVLIGAGANVLAKDHRGRTPLDCVPNVEDDSSSIFNNNKTLRDNAHQLRTIFKEMAPTTTVSTSPTATTVAAEDNDEENDEEQPCSLLLLNQSLLKNQQVSKQNSSSSSSSSFRSSSTYQEAVKTAKVVLSALGIQIGDRVVVGNAKVGVLRYCGPTQFASGIWTGVELDEPIGKHDGTLDGVPYFSCPPKHGIFAPLNKISKLDYDDLDMIEGGGGGFTRINDAISGSGGSSFRSPSALVVTVPCKQYSSSPVAGTNGYRRWYHSYSASGIDMSAVQPKIDTGLGGGGGNVGRSSLGGRFSDHNGHHHHHHHQNGLISSSTSGGGECSVNSEDVHLGSRVYLSDKKTGVVRFIGSTAFAGGIWYGVELTRPLGKHDGAVQGVRYFTCPEGYGVFVPLSRIARLLPPTAPKPTGYSRRTIASISTSTTTTTTTKRQVITTSTSTPDEINSGDETGSEMSLTVSNTSSLDVNINSHHHHSHHPNSKQSPSTLAAVTTNGHHYHHHHQNHHQSNLEPWRSPSAFMPKSADTSASSSTTASSSSAFKFPDSRMVSSSSNLLGSSTGGGATFRRTMSLRRAGSVRSKPIGGGVAQEQQQPQQPSWLRIGVNVLVNGQFATLRYIGKVHFTEGTFLGVELRTPTGKNDGTIDGVRYFICKPNCGLLVRPQKVTVRGISAAKLLPEEAAVLLPTRRNGVIIGKSKEI